jgi:transcriptional regulator with XRE-family HTH domain
MALFFDSEWFDARLASVHLSRADLAAALGLNETQIAEVWKDQRELSARDVALIAALLNVPAEDVAKHAGVSTPVPKGDALADIAKRLERVERMLEDIKSLLKNALARRHE